MVNSAKKFAWSWAFVGACSVVVLSCHTTSDEVKVPQGPKLALGKCIIETRDGSTLHDHCHAFVEPDGTRVVELGASWPRGSPGGVFQLRLTGGPVPLDTTLTLDTLVDCRPGGIVDVRIGDQENGVSYAWFATPGRGSRDTGKTTGSLTLDTLNQDEISGSAVFAWNSIYDTPKRIERLSRFRLTWKPISETRRSLSRCDRHLRQDPDHWELHDEGYCTYYGRFVPPHLRHILPPHLKNRK